MKNYILTFLIGIILISCSNDDDVDSNNQIITENISISNSEVYEYDLGGFGDEEGAIISIQAEHFEISELEREINSGGIIYKYKSHTGFVGTDFVEITTNRGSDGASAGIESFVKIIFNITD